MHIQKRYKIAIEKYERMNAEQGGLCDICGGINTNGRRLYVDHDHNTGDVRGLLCDNCNVGIGRMKDNVEVLENAIAYLRKHKK